MDQAIVFASPPIPFTREPRWLWRAWCYLLGDQAWPFRFEVRYKAGTHAHEVRGAGQWTEAEYLERIMSTGVEPEGFVNPFWAGPSPCSADCWDLLDETPPLDQLPSGGLSVRLLRDVQLSEVARQWHAMAESVAAYPQLRPRAGVPSADALNAALDDALSASTARPAGPGRPSLPDREHLRRLAVLVDTYRAGKTQTAAARRLGITAGALRVSIAWARAHDLWTPAANGRRGEPTPAGLAAIEQWRTTSKGRRTR